MVDDKFAIARRSSVGMRGLAIFMPAAIISEERGCDRNGNARKSRMTNIPSTQWGRLLKWQIRPYIRYKHYPLSLRRESD